MKQPLTNATEITARNQSLAITITVNPYSVNVKAVAAFLMLSDREIQRRCKRKDIPCEFRDRQFWILDEWFEGEKLKRLRLRELHRART